MTKNPWLVEKQVCWLWYWLLCQFWYSQFKLWELSLQGRKIKSTRKAITFLSLPTQLILIKIHGNILISLWNLIYFIVCFWSPMWTWAWNLIFFFFKFLFFWFGSNLSCFTYNSLCSKPHFGCWEFLFFFFIYWIWAKNLKN